MDKLIVNNLCSEKRYALLKGNKIEKLYIEQPQQQSLVGNIYLGTVTKVLPGMNAVFVDIGCENQAFLHRDKLASFSVSEEEKEKKEAKSISSFVHQGEKLLVQVEKDETGTKGARLTGIIELPGDSLIYMPTGRYVAVSKKIDEPGLNAALRHFGNEVKTETEGIIFRTTSALKSDQEWKTELESLRLQYQELIQIAKKMKKPGIVNRTERFKEEILEVIKKMENGEVIIDDATLKTVLRSVCEEKGLALTYHKEKENIFTFYHLDHELEKALKRIVWLDSGAYLVFDETEALTVIDVNTGKFSGKINLQDTVKKTNELAAVEAVRQLRLRDTGGIILIDFIDMKSEKDRKDLVHIVMRELKKDEKQTKVIGFTPLGILQLTRKKTKMSLSESLSQRCSVCEGTGRVFSAETVAYRLERELWEYRHSDYSMIKVEADHKVKAALEGESGHHLKRLEETLGLTISIDPVSSPKPFYYIKQMIE